MVAACLPTMVGCGFEVEAGEDTSVTATQVAGRGRALSHADPCVEAPRSFLCEDLETVVSAGLDRDLGIFLAGQARTLLSRLVEFLRDTRRSATDRQLDTTFAILSETLIVLECRGRSAGGMCENLPGVCVEPGVAPEQPTCLPSDEGAIEALSRFLGMTRPLPPRDPCREGMTPVCLNVEALITAGLDRTFAQLLGQRSPELARRLVEFIRDPRVRGRIRDAIFPDASSDGVAEVIAAALADLEGALVFIECQERSEGQMCWSLPGVCVEPGLFGRDPACIPSPEEAIDLLVEVLGLPAPQAESGLAVLAELLEARRRAPPPAGEGPLEARMRRQANERLQRCLDDPGCEVRARGILDRIGNDQLVPAEVLQTLDRASLQIAADARILVAEFEPGARSQIAAQLNLAFTQIDVGLMAFVGSVVDGTRVLLEPGAPINRLIQVLADLAASLVVEGSPGQMMEDIAVTSLLRAFETITREVCLPTRSGGAAACSMSSLPGN